MSPRYTEPKPVLFPWPLEGLLYGVATFYLLLVCFDLSYFSLRSFYLSNGYLDLEPLVVRYDPIKGAEPHWTTQTYLSTADQVMGRYRQNPQDPKIPALLRDLGQQSENLIQTDPYARIGKTGVLEKLKNRLRQRMGNPSATQSFRVFWSMANLSENNIRYYESQIKPLLKGNYYRKYGEDGEFIDHFWTIDLYFILFFAVELILRTIYLARVMRIRLIDALVTRWYDLIWLIPAPAYLIHWPWIRLIKLIPYLVRSDQLGTPVDIIADYLRERYLQYLANRVTDLVVIKIISDLQNAVRGLSARQVVDLMDNRTVGQRLEQFLQRQGQTLTQYLLPDLAPEIIALVHHLILNQLKNTPGYNNLAFILGTTPETTLRQLLEQSYASLVTSLQQTATPEPKSQQLTEELITQLTDRLTGELQSQHTIEDIQEVLIALLEDVKRGYLAPAIPRVLKSPTGLVRRP